MTEATAVEPRGRITHGDLGLWSDEHVPGLRRIAGFIAAQGSIPAVQIAHAGRKAASQRPWHGNAALTEADGQRGEPPWSLVGPTAEPADAGYAAPAELSPAEIASIKDRFAQSAARADAAGFDILEIHGAHGYLIASFLSPVSNKRMDAYGGDRAGRMRFALEVTAAVRSAWPERKPLFFRMSAVDGAQGGWNIDDSVTLAQCLKERGVDVVDCSSGGLRGSGTLANSNRGPGYQVPFAAQIRREAEIRTMAVGLILDADQAEAILRAGDADLVAIGREAMYDPYWAHHAAQKLGADPEFSTWNEQAGWWLRRRAKALKSIGLRRL